MKCDRYRMFWEGSFPRKDFEKHLTTCQVCQEASSLDRRIEEKAKAIPVPEPSPDLWTSIAGQLEKEGTVSAHHTEYGFLRSLISPRRYLVYKVAALILLSIGLSSFLLRGPTESPRKRHNLLTSSALSLVEKTEKEYERAIEELEKTILPIVAEADTDILLLYRDKLETIDAQIARCREALATNHADAHIRRYLLTAYKDKKETLLELLELTETPSS